MDELKPIADGWKIDSDQKAEWALQRIQEAEVDFQKWLDYYNGMIDRCRKDMEQTVSFMRQRLQEYFNQVPHKETKTQEKYQLPSGELILKKPKSVWKYDPEKMYDWVTDNALGSDYIQVKRSLMWGDLKKRFVETPDGKIADKETGVMCEAVTIEKSEPMFDVRINGGTKDGDTSADLG